MANEGRALITGASSGIGAALARILAARGHDVVLTARSEDALRALASELAETYGVDARVLTADLADPAAPQTIEAALADTPIDVLVNNAGLGSCGPFVEQVRQKELRQIQVNAAALTGLCHVFLPQMLARGRGRILNIASTAAFQPGPYMATYFATKAFVLRLSEALAHEVRGTGVTVTCHCPGATATGFEDKAGNGTALHFSRNVATADDVARDAYDAMMRGDVVAIHGALNRFLARATNFSPAWLVRVATARMNRPA